MKIVFFGNTKYSLIGLRIIHNSIEVSHVVTISDSPVEKFAKENSIPVTITKILDAQIVKSLGELKPDFFVVEDYGLILPNKLLDIPRLAPLNIHHSLLPKYRGPTPVPSAILAGEKVTGVSIIKMAAEVDAGDILAQVEYHMQKNDTTDSVLTKLNQLGADLLVRVIKNFEEMSLHAKKQNEPSTKYTDRMTRESGFIDIHNPPNPETLDRMIRAYYPWPGVWTRLRISLRSSYGGQAKDKIVKFLPERKIQVEGKNAVSYEEFYNGYPELKDLILKLIPE